MYAIVSRKRPLGDNIYVSKVGGGSDGAKTKLLASSLDAVHYGGLCSAGRGASLVRAVGCTFRAVSASGSALGDHPQPRTAAVLANAHDSDESAGRSHAGIADRGPGNGPRGRTDGGFSGRVRHRCANDNAAALIVVAKPKPRSGAGHYSLFHAIATANNESSRRSQSGRRDPIDKMK